MAYRAGEPGKPVVMVVATMQGEENFGQYAARVLEGKPITEVDLSVVPGLNPGGLAKDRPWIKGHVDLDRNFPTKWVHRANSGPSAKSGKETRVIMRFLDRVDPKSGLLAPTAAAIDSDGAKRKGLMRRLAKNLELPKKPLTCGGACHGTMTQWFNQNHKGAAITRRGPVDHAVLERMKGEDANCGARRQSAAVGDNGAVWARWALGRCDVGPRCCASTSTPSSPGSSSRTSRRCAASRWWSAGSASEAWSGRPPRTRPGYSAFGRRCRPMRRSGAARTPRS